MQSPRPTRAIVIVLDSVGIGELPDAHLYADEGSDTVGNIARAFPLQNLADVPEHWPEDRFDLYWILERAADGSGQYRFSVRPQLLLDGDSS